MDGEVWLGEAEFFDFSGVCEPWGGEEDGEVVLRNELTAEEGAAGDGAEEDEEGGVGAEEGVGEFACGAFEFEEVREGEAEGGVWADLVEARADGDEAEVPVPREVEREGLFELGSGEARWVGGR
jgi:hypothetical protein